MVVQLKSLVIYPMPTIGYSVAQDLPTGINKPGKLFAKKETGQGAGMGRVGCFQQRLGRQTEGGYQYLFRWKRSG